MILITIKHVYIITVLHESLFNSHDFFIIQFSHFSNNKKFTHFRQY